MLAETEVTTASISTWKPRTWLWPTTCTTLDNLERKPNENIDDAEVERQARLHDEARQTAIQIDPATVDHRHDIEDAYAIQNAWLRIELDHTAARRSQDWVDVESYAIGDEYQ